MYLYGDIADTLEEALEKGAVIVTDETKDDFDDDMAIPIQVGDSYITEGCLWLYEHEYYPVLDTEYFPFQEKKYWDMAIDKGWMNVVSCKTEEAIKREEVILFHNYEEVILFHNYAVEFNGNTFEVTWSEHKHAWSEHKQGGFHMNGYTCIGQ
jgi:hypothetical protein